MIRTIKVPTSTDPPLTTIVCTSGGNVSSIRIYIESELILHSTMTLPPHGVIGQMGVYSSDESHSSYDIPNARLSKNVMSTSLIVFIGERIFFHSHSRNMDGDVDISLRANLSAIDLDVIVTDSRSIEVNPI